MMPPKLGIIAGGGALPIRLSEHCLEIGRAVFAIILDGHAAEADFAAVPHATFRLGAAGGAIKRLRAEGVQALVLAGDVRKPSLGQLRPDLWSAGFLVRKGVFDHGDDSLLSAVIQALEGEGFSVIGADDIMPELLAPAGCMTAAAPTPENAADIEVGISAARALGARDAGQAVIVLGGRVVAEEDRRGTDAMLAAAAGKGVSGGVLVKRLKPGQERRVDLPTIGPATIAAATAAGLAGIAVSAGDTIIMERETCIAAADRAGIFVIGMAPRDDA